MSDVVMTIAGDTAHAAATFGVRNPATGEVFAEAPECTRSQLDSAFESAAKAYRDWKSDEAFRRTTLLGMADVLMASAGELAPVLTAEQGKPLADANVEVFAAAIWCQYFANLETPSQIIQDDESALVEVVRRPLGVVAAITPWNFPSAMITRKAGPGWAVGCTGVIRPASQTPFSALALGVLAERAGMPPGVCNIITGSASATGKELCEDPRVRKLSFTGSTEVGSLLLAQCAPTVKKTSMELGGNAPFIVFDDADLDEAVKGAMASKFRNTGQTCVCANRLLVQDGVYDAFAEKLSVAVGKLKVGDGMGDGVTQGPLINMAAVEKVEEHITDALAHGARIVTGGKRHALGHSFFEPTILADVPATAMIFSEETFGPVAPLIRFKTEEEAVRLANDTPFGLAAYFYSRDIGRIFRVAEGIEAGIIGINEGIISTEVAPFGGVKASGLGREGSKYGIEDYLEIKYLCIGGIDQ